MAVAAGVSLSQHLRRQAALGAGLPLDGLRRDVLQHWRCEITLDETQLRMLAAVLRENVSLASLDLSRSLDAGGVDDSSAATARAAEGVAAAPAASPEMPATSLDLLGRMLASHPGLTDVNLCANRCVGPASRAALGTALLGSSNRLGGVSTDDWALPPTAHELVLRAPTRAGGAALIEMADMADGANGDADAGGVELSASDMVLLAGALRGHRHLSTLRLPNQAIGVSGGCALGLALRHGAPQLRTLDLHCETARPAAGAVASASRAVLGAEGAAGLARGLHSYEGDADDEGSGSNLSVVGLSSVALASAPALEGAAAADGAHDGAFGAVDAHSGAGDDAALVAALPVPTAPPHTCALTALDLSGHLIGPRGTAAIAAALQSNRSLSSLCLNDCGIGELMTVPLSELVLAPTAPAHYGATSGSPNPYSGSGGAGCGGGAGGGRAERGHTRYLGYGKAARGVVAAAAGGGGGSSVASESVGAPDGVDGSGKTLRVGQRVICCGMDAVVVQAPGSGAAVPGGGASGGARRREGEGARGADGAGGGGVGGSTDGDGTGELRAAEGGSVEPPAMARVQLLTGTLALAESLRVNDTLGVLEVVGNGLGPEAAKLLGEALVENGRGGDGPGLHTLCLSGRLALPILQLKGLESQRVEVYSFSPSIEDGIIIGALARYTA